MSEQSRTAINANDAGAVIATLRKPETWEAVAAAIGEHPYTYDLDDDSHRMDVVQIVCEAAAFHLGGKGL